MGVVCVANTVFPVFLKGTDLDFALGCLATGMSVAEVAGVVGCIIQTVHNLRTCVQQNGSVSNLSTSEKPIVTTLETMFVLVVVTFDVESSFCHHLFTCEMWFGPNHGILIPDLRIVVHVFFILTI